jgi:hypothetical protein
MRNRIICGQNFDSGYIKVYDSATKSVRTINMPIGIITPFAVFNSNYVYFTNIEDDSGAIVLDIRDFSYKYITPSFMSTNSTGSAIGGYNGHIITTKGIIMPTQDGEGTFIPFGRIGRIASSDIICQYGSQYFLDF